MRCFACHLMQRNLFKGLTVSASYCQGGQSCISTHAGPLQSFDLFKKRTKKRWSQNISEYDPNMTYLCWLYAEIKKTQQDTEKEKRESFGFAWLQPLTPHKQHLLPVLMSWSSPRLLPCFETPGHSKLQWTLTLFNYLLLDVVKVMPSARGTFRM